MWGKLVCESRSKALCKLPNLFSCSRYTGAWLSSAERAHRSLCACQRDTAITAETIPPTSATVWGWWRAAACFIPLWHCDAPPCIGLPLIFCVSHLPRVLSLIIRSPNLSTFNGPPTISWSIKVRTVYSACRVLHTSDVIRSVGTFEPDKEKR